MNVAVWWNGVNITSELISYDREQTLCDGVATFSFTVPVTCTHDFDPWDTIKLYEGGDKKGTYFVVDVTKSKPDSIITVSCQDGSKKLSDYFIIDSYFIDYPSYARYWIEKFLTEAGVSYSFNVSDQGNLLSNNTTLGVDSALGVILTLLKQCGWYIYFDEDGDAVIGTATVNLNPAKLTLTDQDSLSIEFHTDDKISRNRVVVWGGTGSNYQPYVTAEVSVDTSWQTAKKDKRTVVYTHSGISSYATANEIALTILDELKDVESTKTIELVGTRDITIAQAVSVSNRDVYNGTGIVTSIGSNMSDKGLTTTLILDEKCPRMFGYYRWGDSYVYCATNGSGVHRKPLTSTVWEDFSTGLETQNIRDLKINNGLLVCVDFDGNSYIRMEADFSWRKLALMDVETSGGTEYTAGSIKAIACAIERGTNNFYLAVTPFVLGLETDYVWVIKYDSLGNPLHYFQVLVNYEESLHLFDMDTDDSAVYVTVANEFGWLVPTTGYSCSYSFTALGETGPTREWTGQSSYLWTEVAFCDGKCYAVRVQLYDKEKINVFRWDHTDPDSISTHESADFAYRSVGETTKNLFTPFIYYDNDSDKLYFAITKSPDVWIYSYEFSSSTLSLHTSYQATSLPTSPYGHYSVSAYKENSGSPGNATCWFYAKIFDFLTGNWSSALPITSIALKEENPVDGFGTPYGGVQHWTLFNNTVQGFFELNTVREGNPPGDNSILGLGSYDEPWIPYIYVVWFSIDLISQSLINNGSLLISPNPSLNYSDSNATTHSYLSGFQTMTGRGNYFGTGAMTLLQITVTDDGPWIPTYDPWPLPPYAHQGHRDGSNPSGTGHNYSTQILLDHQSGGWRKENYSPPIGDAYAAVKTYFTDSQYYIMQVVLSGNEFVVDYLEPNGPAWTLKGDKICTLTDYYDGNIYSYEFGNNLAEVYAQDRATGAILWEEGIATGNYPTNYITDVSMKARENVMAFNVQNLSSADGYIDSIKFMEFSTYYEVSAPAFFTAKESDDILPTIEEEEVEEVVPSAKNFTVIDITTQPHLLEISQNSVVSTYAYSGSNRDSIRCAGVGNLSFFSLMPDKIVGNWPDPGTAEHIWDIRVGKGIPSGNNYNPSGIFDLYTAFDRHLEYTSVISGGGGWTSLATASGISASGISLYSVETTNYEHPPSIFYNVVTGSGVIASGVSGSGVNTFYQRLSGQSNFSSASVNIPNSNITVIRIDDKL